MKVGDKVIKNPDNWKVSDFDSWGRGEGIGEIVSIEYIDDNEVDVRWEGGRCYETIDQIINLQDINLRERIKNG